MPTSTHRKWAFYGGFSGESVVGFDFAPTTDIEKRNITCFAP